jgi:hypothetical protein
VIELLDVIRKYKSNHNLSLKNTIGEIIIAANNQEDLNILDPVLEDLKNVSNAIAISTRLLDNKNHDFKAYDNVRDVYFIEIVA